MFLRIFRQAKPPKIVQQEKTFLPQNSGSYDVLGTKILSLNQNSDQSIIHLRKCGDKKNKYDQKLQEKLERSETLLKNEAASKHTQDRFIDQGRRYIEA